MSTEHYLFIPPFYLSNRFLFLSDTEINKLTEDKDKGRLAHVLTQHRCVCVCLQKLLFF